MKKKNCFWQIVIVASVVLFCSCGGYSSKKSSQDELIVPGYGVRAKLSKTKPSYYGTADQHLLLLKGPVLGGRITTDEYEEGNTTEFKLDHNGWIVEHPDFVNVNITRNENRKNRIESAYSKEPDDMDGGYSGTNYKYYSDGWLLSATMDTPCGEATETYQLNYYHDPLSTHTRGFLGDDVNWKKVFIVTKTDCFHNWLERDVEYYDNGNLINKWHESRVLYYLQVIEKKRSTIALRPFDPSKYETVDSETGGLIYFEYGSDWRCYRIPGKNER